MILVTLNVNSEDYDNSGGYEQPPPEYKWIDCGKCGGDLVVHIDCRYCIGFDDVTCRTCGGAGYWMNPWREEDCDACNGEGYQNEYPCSKCNTVRTVFVLDYHQEVCPDCKSKCDVCNGEGRIKEACDRCNGKGGHMGYE